ncbi:MAG: hypothetical protein ACOYWZ_04895 [Bacillota bacterium]
MDHMGNMSGMSGYGTSLDTFLGGLLILLVKLLMVALVIAVIIGIGVWIKNTFFKNANTSELLRAVNNDPILKTVSVITIAVIGVIFLLALLGSITGPGFGWGGSFGGHSGMIGGFSTQLSIAGLLNLLMKVLTFVLVASLIMALAAYIKKQIDQGALDLTKLNPPGTMGGTNTAPENQKGNNTDNS